MNQTSRTRRRAACSQPALPLMPAPLLPLLLLLAGLLASQQAGSSGNQMDQLEPGVRPLEGLANRGTADEETKQQQQQPPPPPPWSPYDADQARAAAICREKRTANQTDELCYSWRFRYIDEQNANGNDVRLVERSLDERLANGIYTALALKPVSIDFFRFNSGERQTDLRHMRSVAGPRVNDQLCGQHLAEMLSLQGSLEGRLAARRQNASQELNLRERDIRLARVLDAFGRYESGMLAGRTHSMGSHQQCVSSKLLLGGRRARLVGARFCWAQMDLNKHLNVELRARAPTQFEPAEKNFMLGTCLPESCHSRSFVAELAGAQRARENSNLAQRLIDSQFKLPKSLFLEESLAAGHIFCLADEQSEHTMPLLGKLLLGLVAAWLLLACYATWRQELGPQAAAGAVSKRLADGRQTAHSAGPIDRASWTDCLNLRKSWQDFVDEPYQDERRPLQADKDKDKDKDNEKDKDKDKDKDEHENEHKNGHQLKPDRQKPRKVQLDVLNPIKAFGCGFVVLGHAIVIQSTETMDALRALNVIENDPLVMCMIMGTVIVDTFFVITGLLLAYVGMQRSVKLKRGLPGENGQQQPAVAAQHSREARPASSALQSAQLFLKQWARYSIQRHLRLVPLFFLIYALKRTVVLHWAGLGWPFADAGFNRHTSAGACRQESWWVPLTMMTAFLPLSRQCLPQAWSISCDLFFSLAVTPLVLVMTRRPRLALALTLLMGLANYGATLRAYYAIPIHFKLELAHLRAHGFSFLFGQLHYLYTFPHFRLGSTLVGVLFGYALHLFQETERARWPGWVRGWATKFSLGSTLLLFVAVAFCPRTKAYTAPYEFEIYTHLFTSGRIVWAFSNGILFLRMATDWRHSFLMRQFAAGYWSRLVKLNLAILLVHMDVLLFLMTCTLSLRYYSATNIFALYGATYLVCIPLAIFLYVTIENPLDKLVRRHVTPHILP